MTAMGLEQQDLQTFVGFLIFLFGFMLFIIGEIMANDERFIFKQKPNVSRVKFYYFLSKMGIVVMVIPFIRLLIWFFTSK